MSTIQGRRRRVGFTLVELLVVIGIIALLISVLLPALSRAREQAKKTQCLANLRSFGQILNMYAVDFKGCVPLGYNGNKHSGYTVWPGGASTQFEQLGILYEYGYFKNSSEVFYCPNMQDDRWAFNTAVNPWPAGLSTVATRLGMTVRPTTRYTGNVPNGFPGSGTLPDPRDLPENQGKFPALSRMKNKAIAAEMFGWPYSGATKVDPLITCHKNSINVYFADNSAMAVPTGDVNDTESIKGRLLALKLVAGNPAGQASSDIYLDELVTPNRGMWARFDDEKK